ncbi:MAG: efflux RND transporter periplasmic adaptor subunit [Phycisphaerae bacterium]|nr:efflux RND transporter periplasmic adaptor subunit [Phycisphaerae bacterium]
MNRASIIAGVAVFATLGLVGGGLALYKQQQIAASANDSHHGPPPESIRVVEARSIEWRPMADLVGTAFSLRSVRVSNEFAATVKAVRFDSGAIVEAGEVILTLDDSTDRADHDAAMAAVRVAEASVAVGDARLRLVETELERIEEAAKERAATAIEVDRGRSEVERARAERDRMLAEVDQAKARVAQVQALLDKRVIKAPFRARAGIRTVHEGQYLAEGSPVVMLEEVADTIYLDFTIPQEYLARVHPGLVVLATSSVFGDQQIEIEVVAIDATVSNETRNIRVRGQVANPNGLLRPGMFVSIRVPVDDAKPRVVVPSTAVRRSSFADQVFVIVPGEQPDTLVAKQRFVTLGPTVGADVIVLEGLEPGERIAAAGSFKLRDGAGVNDVSNEPAPATPPH